jgi:hypothetical protein
MIFRELEYPGTELKCFLQGWNAFDRVGIPLYRFGMFSTGLECFLQSWTTFVRSWNAFCRVGMLSTGLECFLQGWNAFDTDGIPPIGLECLL